MPFGGVGEVRRGGFGREVGDGDLGAGYCQEDKVNPIGDRGSAALTTWRGS